MKLGLWAGLVMITVWGCSGKVLEQEPHPGLTIAGGGRREGGGGASEPAGGSDAVGGSDAAGAGGAPEEAGAGGASDDAGTGGTAGQAGDGSRAGSGSTDEPHCDFGFSGTGTQDCSVSAQAGEGGDDACARFGSSATLAQLVGVWGFAPFDVTTTLELAADGTASYSESGPESSTPPFGFTEYKETGTFEVFGSSIELTIIETTQTWSNNPATVHSLVSKAHHLWYRYDAASDTLNLAECGTLIGNFTRF